MPFPRLALTEAALPATSTEQIKYKNLNLGSSRVTSRHQRQSSSPSFDQSRSLAICHNPAHQNTYRNAIWICRGSRVLVIRP